MGDLRRSIVVVGSGLPGLHWGSSMVISQSIETLRCTFGMRLFSGVLVCLVSAPCRLVRVACPRSEAETMSSLMVSSSMVMTARCLVRVVAAIAMV